MDRRWKARKQTGRETFWKTLSQFNLAFVKNLQRQGTVALDTVKGGWKISLGGSKRNPTEILEITTNFFEEDAYVNCWHINPNENVLMWGQYVPSASGVAIRLDRGKA